eukprot:scaffold120559_cov63-Phaeocystis_antarctica.AAC.2
MPIATLAQGPTVDAGATAGTICWSVCCARGTETPPTTATSVSARKMSIGLVASLCGELAQFGHGCV